MSEKRTYLVSVVRDFHVRTGTDAICESRFCQAEGYEVHRAVWRVATKPFLETIQRQSEGFLHVKDIPVVWCCDAVLSKEAERIAKESGIDSLSLERMVYSKSEDDYDDE